MSLNEIQARIRKLRKRLNTTLPGSLKEQEILKQIEVLTLQLNKYQDNLIEKIGPPVLDQAHSRKRYEDVLYEEYYHQREASHPIADEILPQIYLSQEYGKNPETFDLLYDAIKRVWKKGSGWWNIVLVGEGGMGKTTSLLALWEQLTSEGHIIYPLPIFLRLADYNVGDYTSKDFIWERIAEQYFKCDLNDPQIPQLREQFRKPLPQNTANFPLFILLLDGFNEINTEHYVPGQYLRKLSEAYENVQIIISSRYDMIESCNLSRRFTKLSLKHLDNDQIDAFLPKEKREFDQEFKTLLNAENSPLRYPMMLAIYKEAEREMALDRGHKRYRFFYAPRNKTELLHDFIEALRARMDKQKKGSSAEHDIYLRHLLPRIGYEMETYNVIRQGKLINIVRDETSQYLDPPYLVHYPKIYKELSHMKTCFEKNEDQDILHIIKKIEEHYALLKEIDEGEYRFFHEDFRDYFTAAYIKKRIEFDCQKLHNLHDNKYFDELAHPRLPPSLHQKILEFLVTIPNLHDSPSQRAFVLGAGLDERLQQQLDFNRPIKQFVNLLVDTLISFEDEWEALESVVEYAKQLGGRDKQISCETLIRELHEQKHPQKEIVSFPDDLFWELKKPVLEPHLRWAIGELIGEPRRRTDGQEEYTSILDKALDVLRNCAHCEINDNRLLNLLEILKATRVDLSDTNLSCLDLRHIVLNNVKMGERTNLTDSRINVHNILPQRHFGWVNYVCYSPDGKKIASAGKDGTIREWDCATGECLTIYRGHNGEVTSLDYLQPDGEKIVSGSMDKTVQEWQVGYEQPLNEGYKEHSGYITSVKYSPDGKRILSGSEDTTVREWDVQTRKCLWCYQEHTDEVTTVSYHPDSTKKRFASGSKDGTIKIWEVGSEKSSKTFYQEDEVTSLCYGQNGKKIIAGGGGKDAEIKEWDTKSSTGQYIKVYKGHIDSISFVCYSPNGKKILSSSCSDPGTDAFFDPLVREWNVGDYEEGDQSCLKRFKEYKEHSHGVTCVNYSPDGRKIISASYDNTIKEWDVFSGKCIKTYQIQESITSVRFAPHKKNILIGTRQGNIKEWDLEQKRCVRIYQGQSDCKAFLGYGNDGMSILAVSSKGDIEEWDCNTEKCTKKQIDNQEKETILDYSPQHNTYLSRSGEHVLNERKQTDGGDSPVSPIPYELKSLYIIPPQYDEDFLKERYPGLLPKKRIVIQEKFTNRTFLKDSFTDEIGRDLWKDFISKKIIVETTFPKLTGAIYHPNQAKILAVYDRWLTEWDVSDKALHILHKDLYSISSVCYNTDGSKILFATDGLEEKLIKERELGTRTIREICGADPEERHKTRITAIHYSPDEAHIISASNDRYDPIRIWETTTGKCIEKLPNEFGLLIQDVDMSEVRWEPKPPDESEKELLKLYGARGIDD